jgi:hypothetical protein
MRGPLIAVAIALGLLWFPFDWLSEVCPWFGVPFRMVFRDARAHLIGHSIFFFLVGWVVLFRLPAVRQKPLLYLAGLVAGALIQESIQALFRSQIPTFTDFNAFQGDAIGGITAFVMFAVVPRFQPAKSHTE